VSHQHLARAVTHKAGRRDGKLGRSSRWKARGEAKKEGRSNNITNKKVLDSAMKR
jgi:hypothetical protein